MSYRKGYFKKDGTYVKGHYVTPKRKYKPRKTSKGGCIILILISLSLVSIISCSDTSDDDCPTRTCSDFSSQAEAQSTFDADISCYRNLDADNDGIACENLSN